ncbi:MAG: putative bifunctional diguanylate cyclase/phosphodiesterase [Pseudomonadota bacterium]
MARKPSPFAITLRDSLLRSGVGRRIFLLFVICAMLPTATLAVLSLRQVTSIVERYQIENLHDSAKNFTIAIYQRLLLADTELAEIAPGTVYERGTLRLSPRASASEAFVGYAFLDAQGKWHATTPAMPELPALTPSQEKHIASGMSLLLSVPGKTEARTVVLMRTLGSTSGGARLLAARIDSGYLWMDAPSMVPSGIVCILDSAAEPLFCPAPALAADSEAVRAAPPVSAPGDRIERGQRYVTVSRDMFLAPRFLVPRWTLMVGEEGEDFLEPLAAFRSIFGWVAVLALLVVALLSANLIRRSLVPLQQLTHTTQRLAHGDLRARVPVEGSDEFATLGASFNDMTDQLERQFRVLATLAEIDRRVLASSRLEDIVDVVVTCAREVIVCDAVSFAVLDGLDGNHMRVFHDHAGHDSTVEGTRYALPPEVARYLAGRTSSSLLLDEPGAPDFLEPLTQAGARRALVLPLMVKGRLTAVLCIGYRDPAPIEDALESEARDFADRIAVAMANAAWEAELYRRAHFDVLTGLPNRQLVQDRLQQALAHASRTGSAVAILFVDLDRFKQINDSLGHSAGDAVLQQIAQRFAPLMRTEDTLARLGGDEFLVVLPAIEDRDAAPAVATAVAERLIEAAGGSIVINGQSVQLAASVGIAIFPADGKNVEELLKNADAAMYDAKEAGRAGHRFYAPELNARAMRRLMIEQGLRGALERDELSIHFQPKFSARSGRLVGAEALMRWKEPREGYIAPSEFIPVAEDSGLILPLGKWILRATCRQIRSWRDRGLSVVPVSVNCSARELRQLDLAGQVETVLSENALDPTLLEIEITESIAMEDIHASIRVLSALRAAGVRLALDDFGTGYSSLSHLKELPVDILKIDQAFVRNVTQGGRDAAMVHSIIVLAHSLGLTVVAEGVETEAERRFLRDANCDQMQGYLLGRPAAAEEFEKLLGEAKAAHAG